MSRKRFGTFGSTVKLMFAGMSVNGTTLSPCGGADNKNSGNPSAASVAAVSPACNISRRVSSLVTIGLLNKSELVLFLTFQGSGEQQLLWNANRQNGNVAT